MDPEMTFVFSESNIRRVVELLISVKTYSVDISNPSKYPIFDVFANVVIEALKFAQVIPRAHDTEFTKITDEIEKCKNRVSTLGKYLIKS